jgi:uncharacterized protein (DUF1800 family)
VYFGKKTRAGAVSRNRKDRTAPCVVALAKDTSRFQKVAIHMTSAFPRTLAPQVLGPIRFGYGHAVDVDVPATATDIFASLTLPDVNAALYQPMASYDTVLAEVRVKNLLSKANKTGDEDALAEGRKLRQAQRSSNLVDTAGAFARMVDTPSPFRARLEWHFTNHFSLRHRNVRWIGASLGFVDEAIRPHIMGHFSDMLRAVETHPAMLMYLDQHISVGPNSPFGRKRKKGLNENLAREMLELHTVGTGYVQKDVRQLAQLLTGQIVDKTQRAAFDPMRAEPGTATVMGVTYEGDTPPKFAAITTVLNDLANSPLTAHHVSTRLAQHFVSDTPDPDLIDSMVAAWMTSDGYLPRVYDAMLAHPASWRDFGAKVKTPLEFIGSSLVAIGVSGADILAIKPNQFKKHLLAPVRNMGQQFLYPPSPEGWPEDAPSWITPQLLSERLSWAMTAPHLSRMGGFRRPHHWAQRVLGEAARPELITALTRASNTLEGAGLMLAAPDFQRR